MRAFLSVGARASVLIASTLCLVAAPVVWAQGIAPADVEQQFRAGVSAWNAGDPVRIVDTLASGSGLGFGYRSRAPRTVESTESQLAEVRRFLASLEYFRITLDEIHTAVDGDVGLAWGFFTEEFHVRGRTPEKVRVRFTTTLKREAGRWRQLLFHRDAQPFDDKGNYIPALAALK